MIYIWPYFAFFSWPLLYRQHVPAIKWPFFDPARYPLKVLCTTVAVMLVVVRYNTTVHPFTLADNRHYMFYVFRTLLRHPLIKYLVVPIYVACAWITLTALGGLPTMRQQPQQNSTPRKRKLPGEEPFPRSPLVNPSPMKRSKAQESTLSPAPRPAFSPRMTEMTKMPQQNAIPKKPQKQGPGHRASFILIWLLATALSIITTTLVEPRYLIVPWLTWRLHMASLRTGQRLIKDDTHAKRPDQMGKRLVEAVEAVLQELHDHSLWLETMWFLTINLATGYVFLCWGFEWPQEPGKVQRFMW